MMRAPVAKPKRAQKAIERLNDPLRVISIRVPKSVKQSFWKQAIDEDVTIENLTLKALQMYLETIKSVSAS